MHRPRFVSILVLAFFALTMVNFLQVLKVYDDIGSYATARIGFLRESRFRAPHPSQKNSAKQAGLQAKTVRK